MTSPADFPSEILEQFFSWAVQFDDPKALEQPLIKWNSEGIFFKRTRVLRRKSLATKASIARVCHRWKELITPSLYEHVAVENQRDLDALTLSVTSSTQKNCDVVHLVKRLDVELVESATGVAPLLARFPSLAIIIMRIPDSMEFLEILRCIPSSLEQLFWTSGAPDLGAYPDMTRPYSELLKFLNSHHHLRTISFPQPFHPSSSESLDQQSQASFPHICEWVVQSPWEVLQLYGIGWGHQLFPNSNRRTCTFIWAGLEYPLNAILTLQNPRPVTGNIEELSYTPNPSITSLSLTLEPRGSEGKGPWFREVWPSMMARFAPNLKELKLRILVNTEDQFDRPLQLFPEVPLAPVSSVTTISVQRMFRNEQGRIYESPPGTVLGTRSEMRDPVGTLYNVIVSPWGCVFPSLEAIRIWEDIDPQQVVNELELPFMEGARKGEIGDLRIEDRFGRVLQCFA